MKAIDQIKVSFYRNVYQKSPEQVKLQSILEAIVKGKYADKVSTIRRYYEEGDKEAAQKLKSSLPCFTASGLFNGAHAIRNLIEPSGCIVIDYDHVPDIDRVRQICSGDSHTLAAFRSPTDGVKIICYVDNIANRHREAYRLVSQYYNRLTGMCCDEACKDESRLCYVSYDPHGYISVIYQSFVLPEQTETISEKVDFPPSLPYSENDIKSFVMSYLFLNPSTKGKRNANLFKLACEACKRGYAENDIYGQVCARLQDSDFTKKEISNTISSGYKTVTLKTTGQNETPDSTPTNDKMTKTPYNCPSDFTTDEENYWQGEEFRKQTPFIPDKVYENIPAQLRDCQLEDNSPRERDLLFLSSLTCFSAMLPQTFGVYDHRLFSPHLYTFCLAPAGSGKGTAQWGAKLLYKLHRQILDESDARIEAYKRERADWQAECARKMKNKEKTDTKTEPKEPAYKCFIIPATTSNTRMQMQLRDNGSLGGIIFDTEARTMTNANKLDCGHFDDMLCKAFGHEMISSSYKANGIKPIVIHRPSLAVFLTGTPEQLNHLIENPESGLPSRFLFYTYREAPLWKEMGNDTYNTDECFEYYADRAYGLYLYCQSHPLRFTFSHAQWQRLNRTFGTLLSEVTSESNDNLQAVVKRYAFITMRIAMILTRIENFEKNSTLNECTCNDIFFETALGISLCCYEHSRLLFTSIPVKQFHSLKDPDEKRRFLDELPDEFTTENATRLSANYSFSARTAMRFISQLIGLKISKICHGHFRKL